jgi:hypothetical protein
MVVPTPQPLTMQFDPQQALTFLQVLGKEPATARLRAFPHTKTDAERKKELRARKLAFRQHEIEEAQALGFGIYVVINEGGDSKASIDHCIAYFAEFDDLSHSEQWERVKGLGMPEPSIVVDTGGGSLHFYWVLNRAEPNLARWQDDMRRLIAHLGSDRSINDPSRVMRLPGAIYYDQHQQPVAQSRIVHLSERTYTREALLHNVPELPPERRPKPPAPCVHGGEDDTITDALDVLSRIPARVPGSNTRDIYLKLLWALAAIVGASEAGRLMAQHSPEWAAHEDLESKAAEATGSVGAGSLFMLAKREWGITARRRRRELPPMTISAQAPASTPFADLPTAAVLSPDGARSELRRLISEGCSGSALEAECVRVAEEYEISVSDVRQFCRQLENEVHAEVQADSDIVEIKSLEAQRAFRKETLTLEYMLPEYLVEPIRYVNESLQSDDLSAAMTFFTAISGIVRTGTMIRGDLRSFVVPPNIYLALIGKSGMGKSPLVRQLCDRVLDKVRLEYAAMNRARAADWMTANQLLPKQQQSAKPRRFMMTIESYTEESLVELLGVHETAQLGLLLKADELAAVFRSLNAYKGGGKGSEEQQLLSLFDGGGGSSIRIGADVREFEFAQFSIIGGMQPRVFDMLASKGDPSGLFARILLCPLPAEFGYRDPIESVEAVEQYHVCERKMQEVALQVFNMQPFQYVLSQSAMKRLATYQYQAKLAADAAELDEQSSTYGKRAGYILRIAGLMHILGIACGDIQERSFISDELVEKAFYVIEHLQSYALNAHKKIHLQADQAGREMTSKIQKVCMQTPLTAAQFRKTHLNRRFHKEYPTDSIAVFMSKLVDAGYGEWIAGARNARAYKGLRPIDR